jgi:hypothetical protein
VAARRENGLDETAAGCACLRGLVDASRGERATQTARGEQWATDSRESHLEDSKGSRTLNKYASNFFLHVRSSSAIFCMSAGVTIDVVPEVLFYFDGGRSINLFEEQMDKELYK